MSDITDKVDKLFSEWDRPDSPGCSLAVIKDGEMIYRQIVLIAPQDEYRGYSAEDLCVRSRRFPAM